MADTKPSLLSLKVEQDKIYLELSTSLSKTYFWKFSQKKQREKFARSQELHQNPLLYTWFHLFPNWSNINLYGARWKRQTVDFAEI